MSIARIAGSVTLSAAFCVPVFAQGATSPVAEMRRAPSLANPITILDLLRYDTKQQGPMIFVGVPEMPIKITEDDPAQMRKVFTGMTVTKFAEGFDSRVLTIGGIKAVVPRTMQVVVTNPGKPDPFADMSGEERLQILFSLWTPEQWAKAGGDRGIGIGDLTEEQRPLWSGIFPSETIPLNQCEVVPDDEHGEVFRTRGKKESVPATAIRLRITRRTTLTFHATGKEAMYRTHIGNENGLRRTEADGTVLREELEVPDGYSAARSRRESAYGVKLFPTVPGYAKPGQLDLNAPGLRVPIRLNNASTTVKDLLKSVATATRLEIVADRRYGALPAAVRTRTGGQTVPASDLLKAITRSVNGTFRRVEGADGSALYLLTDDAVGYGTRLARLSDWAEKPFRDREKALLEATAKAAEKNPLSVIHFRDDDPLALPEKLRDTAIGSISRTEVPFTDLSPALQKATRKAADDYRKGSEPIAVQTDKITLGSELRYEWVVPDGRAFVALFYGRLDGVIGALAPRTNTPAPVFVPVAPEPLAKMPTPLKRRVVVLPLPANKAETESLLALVKRKGFNEAWFRLPFADAEERARETVALGKIAGVRVGAVIGWLRKREANPDAPEEIDVRGENGNGWRERLLARALTQETDWIPHYRDVFTPKFIGWVVPRNNDALTVAAKVARTPGLNALVLENTAAPGYGGWGTYGDGLLERVRLGYHADLRLACIRANGFDPVDVGDDVVYASTDYPDSLIEEQRDALQKELALFRFARNEKYMATVFESLGGVAPRAPIYLSDRSVDGTQFPYYVRWDKAERTPAMSDGGEYEEAKARADALRCSSESLLVVTDPHVRNMEVYFAESWSRHGKSALQWRGLVYRIERTEPKAIREALELLPDDSPPSTPADTDMPPKI